MKENSRDLIRRAIQDNYHKARDKRLSNKFDEANQLQNKADEWREKFGFDAAEFTR